MPAGDHIPVAASFSYWVDSHSYYSQREFLLLQCKPTNIVNAGIEEILSQRGALEEKDNLIADCKPGSLLFMLQLTSHWVTGYQ